MNKYIVLAIMSLGITSITCKAFYPGNAYGYLTSIAAPEGLFDIVISSNGMSSPFTNNPLNIRIPWDNEGIGGVKVNVYKKGTQNLISSVNIIDNHSQIQLLPGKYNSHKQSFSKMSGRNKEINLNISLTVSNDGSIKGAAQNK